MKVVWPAVAPVLMTLLTACGPARPAFVPVPPLAYCRGAGDVIWADTSEASQRAALDAWCRSVGPPVVSLQPAVTDGEVSRVLILSWNIHVGGGQVSELVARLRREAEGEGSGDVGIVLLLQEAFRSGDAVPAAWPEGTDPPGGIRPTRFSTDVAALARDLGMAVAYVPSMRNGDAWVPEDREDRGSAILSTEPLSDITAIELPMLKQRRVAVMATVTPRGSRAVPLRVISTHLDTRAPRVPQARALARYLTTVPPPLVMGGDLNTLRGIGDAATRALGAVLNVENCGTGRTHLLGRFDFILSTLGESPARTCATLPEKYSSDHRPLLLTLDY